MTAAGDTGAQRQATASDADDGKRRCVDSHALEHAARRRRALHLSRARLLVGAVAALRITDARNTNARGRHCRTTAVSTGVCVRLCVYLFLKQESVGLLLCVFKELLERCCHRAPLRASMARHGKPPAQNLSMDILYLHYLPNIRWSVDCRYWISNLEPGIILWNHS